MGLLYLFLCVTVLFPVALYCCIRTVFSRQLAKWKQSNIPFYPTGQKHFSRILRKSTTSVLHRVYRKNADKDLLAFFIGPFPVIFVRDPPLIKKIFVKNSDKTFNTIFVAPKEAVELQSSPFFSSDKTQWKAARSTMSPLFSSSRLGQHFEKFKIQTERLWSHLSAANQTKSPVSVIPVAEHFIWDSMYLSNFNEDANSYDKEPKLYDLLHNFFEVSFRRTFVIYSQLIFLFLQSYGFGSLKIVPRKHLDLIKSLLERQMEKRLKDEAEQGDLIDYCLAVKENSDVSTQSQSDLIFRQLTGHTLNILIGGTDTVSHMCYSTVHTLSLHPEYQDRIKKEIDDVMLRQNASELTFEVIQELRFTEQCVYETSRLIPIITVIMRRCTEDFQLPGTNYSFRKGDVFLTAPYSVQRDPKYFKDPDKFDPERFSPENRSSLTSEAYLPFGFGPRKCPGYKLGVLQVVLFIASILLKYEIKPRSHLKLMTENDFSPSACTNVPKKELLVDLVPRSSQHQKPFAA